MESYKEEFRSGRWLPPSSGQIEEWMENYLLSRSDLAKIIGIGADDVRRFCNSDNRNFHNNVPFRSKHFMSYAEVRLFLIWADKIDPEVFGGGNRQLEFFDSFTQKLIAREMSFRDFSKRFLGGMNRDTFFHYRRKNDDNIKKMIEDGMNVLDRELY